MDTTTLGLIIIYVWIHAIIIQLNKTPFDKRTGYEKFISVTAIVTIVLCVLGTIMG